MKPLTVWIIALFAVVIEAPAQTATPTPSHTGTRGEGAERENWGVSKPLWTKKGYPASEDIMMLEKAIRIALEKDEAALEQLYLRGDIFITEDGIAVSWEESGGFLSGVSQVRIRGTLREFWLPTEGLTDVPPPPPPPEVVILTTVPMPKDAKEKIDAEKAAKAQAERKLFEKQEAEREARGDFSQAPGLTPDQRETAEIRWAEKHAGKIMKNATPAPQ